MLATFVYGGISLGGWGRVAAPPTFASPPLYTLRMYAPLIPVTWRDSCLFASSVMLAVW